MEDIESGVADDLRELIGEEVDCGSAASSISESLLICSAVKAEGAKRVISTSSRIKFMHRKCN